jgi:hypothetical protein
MRQLQLPFPHSEESQGITRSDAEKQAIDRVKKSPVHQLDPKLPKEPLADWFRQVVGPATKIKWEVNDCGEQTGSSADAGRDLPICVGAQADLAAGRSVSILIFVGTSRKVRESTLQVYDISVRENGRLKEVRGLHTLPSALKSAK